MNGMLRRKLARDLRRNWQQFFAVFLMALLSSLCYVGLEGAWHGLEVSLDRSSSKADLADGWVHARTMTSAQVEQLQTLQGVKQAEAATQIWVSDISAEQTYVRLEVGAPGELSRPEVVEGESFEAAATGIWLDREYARAHDIEVGDQFAFTSSGGDHEEAVLGLVVSPEEVYFTGTPALGAPEPEHYGYGYASSGVFDQPVAANLVRFTGDTDAVIEAAPSVLGADYLIVQTSSTRTSVATAVDRVGQVRNLSYLFSGLFILLALLAMFTAIRRLVAMQRQEIAVMQALGFARRSIRGHYLAFGLATGGAGALVGALVAPGISLFVLDSQKAMFALSEWTIAYTPLSAAVVLLIAAACSGSAWFALRRPLRLRPAEGLRQAVGRARRVAVERVGGIWRSLNYGARWALRDSMLNRVRFLMGIVAAVGCMMLLFAGFGVSDSMYNQVNQMFAVERTHDQRVALAPGASTAELPVGTQLMQETVARLDGSVGDHFIYVVDPGESLRLTVDGKSVPRGDGIYVSAALAERLGLAVGAQVELALPAQQSRLEGTVVALIDTSSPQGFYVTSDFWEQQDIAFQPSIALTPAGVSLGADQYDQASQVLDRALQVDNGNRLVAGLESIFMLIRVFAIILAVVVLYSLGSLAFTERTRDYATLAVLGFSRRDLRRLVGTENGIMTVVGLLLGIPAGYWFLTVYVTMFDTPDVVYYPHITWVSVACAVGITALSALSTTIFLRRRVRSVNMVEALKGVE